jgi:hypothetical protein
MTIPTGATRLFSIIGDPVKYVESPTRLLSCNVDTDGIDRDGMTETLSLIWTSQ